MDPSFLDEIDSRTSLPPNRVLDVAKLVAKPEEVVVDRATGEVRQAGADGPGALLASFRELAESSLWFFARAILGLERLNEGLHLPVCNWLQACPPYRKLLLLPRDHLKSSIVSKALPIHLLVQGKRGHYLPGKDGANTRILLACENATNAQHFLRWIAAKFEGCSLLRALWPHRCWMQPRKESRKWNESELLIPRSEDYPEASIETIGVGGAVTGRHVDVLIKDDLVTLDAANSQPIMETAIKWHVASRALLDDPSRGLEFIVGTRWAVGDLYGVIQKDDTSVEVMLRRVLEDGKPIFPELFTKEAILQIQKEMGRLFPLLYMNSEAHPDLTDFDMDMLRCFKWQEGEVELAEDARDALLHERHDGHPVLKRGTKLTGVALAQLIRRGHSVSFVR